ncbi:MAG: hypothetical protein KJZ65_15165 [Phycisphaerales bacterium]|nr:hypothetical protein [Phycisphaerales bacterium]
MGQSGLERTASVFHTTSWTMIQSLAERNDPGYESVMRALTERYWPPVYATLRRMGHRPEQAAEETQAFFVDVVLGRSLFSRADATRGRFRTLMHAALKNYLLDQHRRTRTRAVVHGVRLGDLEAEERFLAGERDSDPCQVFERRWMLALLDEAIDRCARYFTSAGLSAHWEGFRRAVLLPAMSGAASPDRAQLAADLGFASAQHLASALQVVRKRMKIVLREVTAETAVSPEEQDDEFARLMTLRA